MEMVASQACQEVFGRADSLQPGKRMGARLGRSWTGAASRGRDHWRHWGVGFNWLDLVAWRSMIIGNLFFYIGWSTQTPPSGQQNGGPTRDSTSMIPPTISACGRSHTVTMPVEYTAVIAD